MYGCTWRPYTVVYSGDFKLWISGERHKRRAETLTLPNLTKISWVSILFWLDRKRPQTREDRIRTEIFMILWETEVWLLTFCGYLKFNPSSSGSVFCKLVRILSLLSTFHRKVDLFTVQKFCFSLRLGNFSAYATVLHHDSVVSSELYHIHTYTSVSSSMATFAVYVCNLQQYGMEPHLRWRLSLWKIQFILKRPPEAL